MTDAERRRRVEEVCDAALEREGPERAAFVAAACGADDVLRHEVEALLGHAQAAERFLAAPIGALAAQVLDDPPHASPIGRQTGPYTILSRLGAGGMGEVYRARDTRLKRDVALKILPESFANDPERLARFQREAEVLASLNHPHIAAIYGVEDSGSTRALVMELVEGPTLADRIAKGPIPVDEALPMARQIAEALEAAHEQGIIHRDLKPANIKIRPDGTVKVLDFGLAKAIEPASISFSNASHSPTITTHALTQSGMVLGTAAYMSPEQARGKDVDQRADIWAFGCVLYEMLTAQHPFDGEDVSETVANLLRSDPDWLALPEETPGAIRLLLQSCLFKDRGGRMAAISTAVFVLRNAASLASPTGTVAPALLPPRHLWRRVMPFVALTAAAVAALGLWLVTRSAAPVPRVSRLLIAPSGSAALTVSTTRDLAITPDGSRIVYVANRGTQLLVRAMDSLEPVVVFTGEPNNPFVSPDGQWIGFFDGTSLRKVAITGGPSEPLGTVASSRLSRGATWGANDTIIVGTEHVTIGLQRLVTGGEATVLTTPDRSRGELFHVWPEILPGGRAVLFTVIALTGGLDAAQVVLLDLTTGTRRVLVRGGSGAHYVPSGHLVYSVGGPLYAVAFDLDRLETYGPAVPIVPEVLRSPTGGTYSAIADNGTLVYAQGIGVAGNNSPRTLVWVDREGRESLIPAPARAYMYPRVSPDGTRIAVRSVDQERDIWVWDLARLTLTRITADAGYDGYPMWMPDGRLVYSSDRTGSRNIFVKSADATSAVERLTDGPYAMYPTAVSPDSRRLIFTAESPATNDDIMELQLAGERSMTALLNSSFGERNGVVSPDGRWLAYETNDSGGGFEVSVRPFPNVNSGQWQVSTMGGTRPLWAPDGKELFYISSTGALMHVDVALGPSWSATTPTMLIREGYFTMPDDSNGRTYDVTADGTRFLMVRQVTPSEGSIAINLIVIQNWFEELKRLVPTN